MKVARRFRDKYTGEIYLPGDPFKSDDDRRLKDLLQRGLIEEYKVKEIDLQKLTNKELKKRLETEGIEYDVRATKKELIALLGGD